MRHARKSLGFIAAVIAAGCGSSEELTAVDDSVAIEMNESVSIDVLANDVGYDENVAIEIVNPPLSGEAQVVDSAISYDPVDDFIGVDDIKYRIVNENGDFAEARIGIDIACPNCLQGRNIRLKWLAPETDVEGNPVSLIGFRVYSAEDDAPESMVMRDDLTMETSGFNFEEPEIVYDAWRDLGMFLGERMCFRLTAYNAAGESDFSNSACVTIDQENDRKGDFPLDL